MHAQAGVAPGGGARPVGAWRRAPAHRRARPRRVVRGGPDRRAGRCRGAVRPLPRGHRHRAGRRRPGVLLGALRGRPPARRGSPSASTRPGATAPTPWSPRPPSTSVRACSGLRPGPRPAALRPRPRPLGRRAPWPASTGSARPVTVPRRGPPRPPPRARPPVRPPASSRRRRAHPGRRRGGRRRSSIAPDQARAGPPGCSTAVARAGRGRRVVRRRRPGTPAQHGHVARELADPSHVRVEARLQALAGRRRPSRRPHRRWCWVAGASPTTCPTRVPRDGTVLADLGVPRPARGADPPPARDPALGARAPCPRRRRHRGRPTSSSSPAGCVLDPGGPGLPAPRSATVIEAAAVRPTPRRPDRRRDLHRPPRPRGGGCGRAGCRPRRPQRRARVPLRSRRPPRPAAHECAALADPSERTAQTSSASSGRTRRSRSALSKAGRVTVTRLPAGEWCSGRDRTAPAPPRCVCRSTRGGWVSGRCRWATTRCASTDREVVLGEDLATGAGRAASVPAIASSCARAATAPPGWCSRTCAGPTRWGRARNAGCSGRTPRRPSPVDPTLAYFQSYAGQQPTDSPLVIHESLRRLRPDIRVRWGVDDPGHPGPRGCRAGAAPQPRVVRHPRPRRLIVTNIEMERWFRRRPGPGAAPDLARQPRQGDGPRAVAGQRADSRADRAAASTTVRATGRC